MATEAETDIALDKLFAAGRSGPQPSDALMARIAADAEAQVRRPVAAPRRRMGIAEAVLSMLGGWPALTGMATAAAAGVWFGYASPDLVDGYLSTEESVTLGDFLPDMTVLAEGG